MKYKAYYYDPTDEEKTYEVVVSVRHDAKLLTVFRKIGKHVAYDMFRNGVAEGQIKAYYDLPNVWTNGYLGWLNVGNQNITVISECGACIAN